MSSSVKPRCSRSSRSLPRRVGCADCSELTERPQTLVDAFRRQGETPGLSITIGGEHRDPRLEAFTVVTSEYRSGTVAGFIGVIGPTRMPYDKVIALVTHTSRLVSDLLD